nr:immunoglobulin light chain junction region [Macaca mulatta]MOX52045.1 immunoglobulin light chain junction region [Macaca mulatta]MOX52284.1 immunoglobulin light chain junction region [Macaca mulatta]MOX52450.1 immunoglobulin light chain junction region [Macaca mulatta]MOX52616.1 immunoglobulin light chain junction region [Macaca mulatta]
CQQYKNWNSF